MIDKSMKHADICSFLNDTYKRKNHDYGDSFAQLRNRLPNAILTRLFDKYLRLETLLNGATQEVKDESINDTLMDMANYCIMELVERGIDANAETVISVADEFVMGDEDVSEPCEPVKGKYDGLSNGDLLARVCDTMDNIHCKVCPIPSVSNGKNNGRDCVCYKQEHPEEFRKIAIAHLEGLEGKA